MDLPTRAALVVGVLAAAFVAWALVSARRGRTRAPRRVAELPARWAPEAGSRLTLVQISSEHCSSCAQARRVWRAATAGVEGAVHLEVDAAEHLDVVTELGILTTPTTLLYDGDGVLVGRVTGAPSARQAADALTPDTIGAAR